MMKMNGKVLEFEQGTIGVQHFDASEMNRALNAWAKRRGFTWDRGFRSQIGREVEKKKGGPIDGR